MIAKDVEILRAACCVAGLDEHVCEKERALLERIAQKLGVGRVSLEAMIARAQTDQDFYREMFRSLSPDPDKAEKTLARVAIADGVLTMEERVILQHLAERLGMPDERYQQIVAAMEKAIEEGKAGEAGKEPA